MKTTSKGPFFSESPRLPRSNCKKNKPPTWKMYKLFLALFFPCILPGHLKLAFKSHLLLKEKKNFEEHQKQKKFP